MHDGHPDTAGTHAARRRRVALALAAVLAALGALAVLALLHGSDGAAPPGPAVAETPDDPGTAAGAPAATVAAARDAAARSDGDAGTRADGAGAESEFAAERTGYRGRVVDRGGMPVAGITVRVFRAAIDVALLVGADPFALDVPAPRLEAARVHTAADGTFTGDGVLPRGLCWIVLQWDDPAAAPSRQRGGDRTVVPVEFAPAPGEIQDLGDLVLKNGALLRGRVVDHRGEPVADALVRAAILPPLPFAAIPIERIGPGSALLASAGDQRFVGVLPPWFAQVLDALPISSATTRGDGAFELCGVDAGSAVVAVTTARRGSLLVQNVAVEGGTERSLGDLQLPDAEIAEVLVADADGEPVAGAEVVVAPLSVGVPVHVGAAVDATDADGRTWAPGLPRGRALAAARRSPRDAWTIGEPGPAGGMLRVVLPSRHDLSLRVLGPDGAAIARPELRLFRGGAGARLFDAARLGMLPHVDVHGRLDHGEDGVLRVRDLDAGPYQALVRAPGTAATSLTIDLAADTERTVQLRAARALPVRVLDTAGEPVALATIFVQPRGGDYAQRIADLPHAAGRTGADGRCTVRDLPTDETLVSACHPRHGSVHAVVRDEAPAELLLRFEGAARIEGRLTDGGRPPAPGRWVVVLEPRYDEARPRGAAPEVPRLEMPDLDGRFTFAALQPGRYRLTAQDSVTDLGTVAGLVQYQARRQKIFPWNHCEVELHAGETREVRLDAILDVEAWTGPGAPVLGTVTLDGAPAVGALVVGTSKKPERRVTSRVDRGGAFDLGRCPAGELRVVVVPRDVAESRLLEHLFSHTFARDVAVQDGAPLDLRIDVATGALAGRVRDQTGAPVADCRIVLFDRGGGARSSALRVVRTAADGSFRVGGLPAGRYELRAHKDSFGRADLPAVEVTPGHEPWLDDVVLRRSARVAGRVQLEGRPIPGGVRLAFEPDVDGETMHCGVDAQGRFELRDVAVGGYRVRVHVPDEARPRDGGSVFVHAPALLDLALVGRR